VRYTMRLDVSKKFSPQSGACFGIAHRAPVLFRLQRLNQDSWRAACASSIFCSM
jgi:hypothetical protein